MPYKLILSGSERSAIDWIGDRYSHGNELCRLLLQCRSAPEELAWIDDGDIEYAVPECLAWEISQIIDEDKLACFADSLREKLHQFQASIV